MYELRSVLLTSCFFVASGAPCRIQLAGIGAGSRLAVGALRRVTESPDRARERLAQHMAQSGLLLDHLYVPGFAMVRERQEELQPDEPPGPLHGGRVRIDDRPRRLARHVRGLRVKGLGDDG